MEFSQILFQILFAIVILHFIIILFMTFKELRFSFLKLDERQRMLRSSTGTVASSLATIICGLFFISYLLGLNLSLRFVLAIIMTVPMIVEVILNVLLGLHFSSDNRFKDYSKLFLFTLAIGIFILIATLILWITKYKEMTLDLLIYLLIWGIFDIAVYSAFFYRKHQDGLEEEEDE